MGSSAQAGCQLGESAVSAHIARPCAGRVASRSRLTAAESADVPSCCPDCGWAAKTPLFASRCRWAPRQHTCCCVDGQEGWRSPGVRAHVRGTPRRADPVSLAAPVLTDRWCASASLWTRLRPACHRLARGGSSWADGEPGDCAVCWPCTCAWVCGRRRTGAPSLPASHALAPTGYADSTYWAPTRTARDVDAARRGPVRRRPLPWPHAPAKSLLTLPAATRTRNAQPHSRPTRPRRHRPSGPRPG
jgi:hypothetical protein